MVHAFFMACFAALAVSGASGESPRSPAEKADTREGIGRISGNCMPGPCLPHASVYPSPDTLWPHKERPNRGAPTNGFYPDDPCVGFSQLHCQGTGGTVTYGLFLVSPTTGSGESEEELASPLTLRETRPYRFRGRLEKWGCEVALAPTAHGAIYTFDFDSDGGRLVFNAKRKIALPVATSNAVVKVSDDGLTVSGGGTYFGNWNPAPYDCYFHSVQERKGRRITLRIAVSFKSEAKAREYLEKELAGRSLDEVSLAAKAIWDERLSCVEVGGLDPAEETKFYSQLFHAFVQPRDRTGDFAAWGGDEAVWDDHYTLWDTWKTLFPLMAIVDPAMVAGNVNSFAARLRKNGTVTAAFIQGREYRVGQGGDEQDNVIADAWAKKIPGIDWEGAWAVLEHDAAHRTPEYRKLGWVPYGVGETIPTDYCWRLKSASSTLGFAYNDWCAAQVAKGLGKPAAAAALEARSANWTNIWDAALVDKESGYRGFVHGRFPDGRFTDIEPRSGYQIYQRPGWQDYWGDFYEGSAWMYSYNVWHDLPHLIGLMGGREKFLARLSYAFDHDLIEYGNEPNFMTPWLFDFVGCPDLAGKWAHRFLENYPRRPHPGSGSPGDDDSGAMGSMYVFLTAGLYPIAGQDLYALHAPAAERIRFRLPASGKDFTILAPGARRGRSAFKSVKLNGKPLAEPFVRHSDFLAGGELRFELTGNKDD